MSWMIDEQDSARWDIARRAGKLGITGTPDQAAHALGSVNLIGKGTVEAHVIHAVDPIITDGDEIVLINRSNDPGKGKPALPGGFIDPAKGGGVESAVQAAAREALEEVDVDLEGANATLIGTRNMNRPFDVRIAASNGLKEKYGINEGDVFMVSTQAVRFDVPDLANTQLKAGDDAQPGSARRVKIATLKKEDFGISDHFYMVAATFPHIFKTIITSSNIEAFRKVAFVRVKELEASADEDKQVTGELLAHTLGVILSKIDSHEPVDTQDLTNVFESGGADMEYAEWLDDAKQEIHNICNSLA